MILHVKNKVLFWCVMFQNIDYIDQIYSTGISRLEITVEDDLGLGQRQRAGQEGEEGGLPPAIASTEREEYSILWKQVPMAPH